MTDLDYFDEELAARDGALSWPFRVVKVREMFDELRAAREKLGALEVWKDEALRRREAQRNTDLASQETMRVVVESGTAHVRTPARDFYAHTGQTVVVRADGSGGVVWPEETDG